VYAEWEDGTGYVNGQIYWPPPPVPPTTYPLERLKSRYGEVPAVAEYVRAHSGDETEVWNEAVREWEKQTRTLTREAGRQYMADLESGKTADEAAEVALNALCVSPLVDTAEIFDESGPTPQDYPVRMIKVQWAGLSDKVLVELNPEPPRNWPSPKPMAHDDFEAFVRILRRLEGEGPVTLEIKGGNMFYMSGPGTEERIEKQRREEQ